MGDAEGVVSHNSHTLACVGIFTHTYDDIGVPKDEHKQNNDNEQGIQHQHARLNARVDVVTQAQAQTYSCTSCVTCSKSWIYTSCVI